MATLADRKARIRASRPARQAAGLVGGRSSSSLGWGAVALLLLLVGLAGFSFGILLYLIGG